MNRSDIMNSLLTPDSFIPLNITLGNSIGLRETAFIAFLFCHKNQLKLRNLDQEFFPLPVNEIMEKCPLLGCERTIRELVHKLCELGLIETKRKGTPPVNHFKINREAIADIIIEASPYKNDNSEKREEKSQVDKNLMRYVINRYQSLARKGAFPVITKMTTSRTSQIVTRVKEYPEREYWRRLFDKITNDTFLWRTNNPEMSWLTFDFIFTKGNADKIIDGKYDFKVKDFVDMSKEENNPELLLKKNETDTSLRYYQSILQMEKYQKTYRTASDRIDGLFEIALAAEMLADLQEARGFNFGVSNFICGDDIYGVFRNFLNSEFKKMEIITPRMILESVVPFIKHIEGHGGNTTGDLKWEKYIWERINK